MLTKSCLPWYVLAGCGQVCREGWYLLEGDCHESCPSSQASSGVGQFKRRCAEPFTCRNGRLVVEPSVNYGCKCATEDNTAIADCQSCEHRAGEHGQHCTRCNGGKFLFENQCERDNCDGLVGMIEYSPGSYGRECRAPFSCVDRVDEAGNVCKCAASVGRNDCLVRAGMMLEFPPPPPLPSFTLLHAVVV